MSNFPSDSYRLGAANRDPEEEALGWVVRLTSGEVTAADEREFALWRKAPDNALAYDRAQRLWQGIGPILEEQEAAGWPAAAPEPTPTAATRRRFPRNYRYLAIAASLALTAFLTTLYVQFWQYDHVSGTRVEQPLTLADGSQMTMGPGTAMTADFAKGVRRVELARGEAFFDVRHDPAHPFIVTSGKGLVRVLGTAFSVRKADDDRVIVTVTRGKVQVTSGANTAYLTPNRQVSFGPQGLSHVRAVDASLAMAWTRGRLIMEHRPLGAVLRELDRYRLGRIILLNREASQRQINAVIDLARTDNWLEALASSQGLKLDNIGPVTILR